MYPAKKIVQMKKKADFITIPVSRGETLAQDEIWSGGGGADDEVHSLHLKTLVDNYLEATSPPLRSSFCNSPLFLLYPSYALPSNYEDHKSLVHELQATFQILRKNYEELRKEIMRAIQKGETHKHSRAHAPNPSYELLHVLVLEHLRKLGFNAGICKSQRDPEMKSQRCPFPSEEYEYMDVILAEKGTQAHASERVIIDLRFRSQFEIARPSTAYADLLKVVPAAYVGTPRVLQKVLRSLSEAMKKSLESQDMSLPPWRTLAFLCSKWLSSHYSRSIFAPPSTNLNHIQNKLSTKRENFLWSTHKSPSYKRECSNCIVDINPTYGVPKPSRLVDSKHKSTKRENSHSLMNNPSPPLARPPLDDRMRILKSTKSTSHIQRNGSNKQSSIQSGDPMKVPWQLPPLASPPSSVFDKPKRLVGALTLALHNA